MAVRELTHMVTVSAAGGLRRFLRLLLGWVQPGHVRVAAYARAGNATSRTAPACRGRALASLRNRRVKARKSVTAIEWKFGDATVVPVERNTMIDSALAKVTAALR